MESNKETTFNFYHKKVKEEEGKHKKGVKKPTHNCSGNPIDWHPPKTNDLHEQVNKLTKCNEFWCGNPKCLCWENHLMKDHAAWHNKIKEAHQS